ncbi:proto-oncogene c-Rel-like isoform X2 [Ischnura elegans]|nr:proto-oncogene c-Rel-like isoform X2 [Ischnura elegans]
MVDTYRPETEENLNISDVIEVIQTTDPDFVETDLVPVPGDSGAARVGGSGGKMYSGIDQSGGGGASASAPPGAVRRRAYINIIEQPASKALRFRYECEGRSAGSIPGVNSTPENKTFPAIQVVGYKGRAIVVVSCVTKDPPYRPHPHNLVGKEGCKKGVCTVEMNSENMVCTFSNLGIQCVKKKDIEEALKVREDIRVDPYRTGFAHRSQPSSIDLNAVRLCFQVFLEGSERGKFNQPLTPVVSDPIYDKKAMSDLVICKLSDCTCSVAGGKEIILLCEKVAKEDIQIRFYEESDGQLVWEGFGDFQPTHVHKQVAISFRTPRYKKLEVESSVKVCIQLRRPSDGATSEPLPFEFIPLDSDPIVLKRKRQKLGEGSPHIMRQLHDVPAVMQRHGVHAGGSFGLGAPALDPSFPMNPVKCEPVDPSQYRYSPGAISPMYPANPSPVPRLPDYPTPMRQQSPSPMPPLRPPPSSQQRLSPMGTMASPFPVSLVVVGDQNIYNMQAPMRRDPPQGGQAYMGAVAQPSNVCAANNPYSTQQQQQPNPPAQSAPSNPMQMEGGAMGGEQQNFSMELSLGNLDSADLSGMGLRLSETNMLFDANLSENLSSHLTLSDAEGMQRGQQSCALPQQIQPQQPLYDQEMLQHAEGLKERRTDGDGAVGGAVSVQQNMTDSFTNQIKTTIEDICTLNDMYKGTNSDGVDRN